jgi:hypothetical protein
VKSPKLLTKFWTEIILGKPSRRMVNSTDKY